MKTPLWSPDANRIERANLTGFRQHVNKRWKLRLTNYQELYDWSITRTAEFWESIAEFSGIRFREQPVAIYEPGETFYCTNWFRGAKLNYAEHLLRYRDDGVALVQIGESGSRRELCYGELYDEVSRFAQALAEAGVQKGDRVAGFMPNTIETVVAMLASASLGAIWSSCSPDFGVQGVLDRFGQIEPKVLLIADGYTYSGKRNNSLDRAAEFLSELPSLQQVVVVPHLDRTPDISSLGHAVLYEDFLKPFAPCEIEFLAVPFTHPLFIMYSSGTTGLPKSIVHGQGGTLLQHAKELLLHTDLRREDTLFYFTTCGWMMWNWLVSSLFVGSTVVLYDGNPLYPDAYALWKLVEEQRVTVFGTSAKYLSAVEKAGVQPGQEHDLSRLRALLSTGSPLAAEQFDWVYEAVKADLQLASISGGTDIISCFALGDPTGAVWRGELQVRGLGMAVEVFDESGHSLVGEKGELVCTRPFPSVPIYFWNDDDGSRYRASYFEEYGNTVWHHGDYAELTEHGGLIIHGRSDAVLNPGGVRIGTAEIYRVVERFDEVVESIAIGQKWGEDIRVVLFVRLSEGLELTGELRDEIRRRIREQETPRHVPAKVIQVADIPRTISGKISEVAVRKVVHREPVKNRDALQNPEALELFRDLWELSEE